MIKLFILKIQNLKFKLFTKIIANKNVLDNFSKFEGVLDSAFAIDDKRYNAIVK